MIYKERFPRSAYFIQGDDVQKMRRVPFMENEFSEAWLQELLEFNPSILPTSDISAAYAPLLCIGREVPVGSGDTKGYIDNLYVTPTGGIVIVETKLFRNQESRRTVVAQIIDYAKELQKWDAEMLDVIAGNYFYQQCGQSYRVIDAMVAGGHLSFTDEASLTDAINHNLETATFLLLIVGDGIRSNVVQLAEFLNDNTSMSFNLSLVELEIYNHTDGIIVLPNIVTKTTIIERRLPFQGRAVLLRDQNTSQPYESKPLLSRREFVEVFADRGGYDPDLVTEFLLDVEAVDGISIRITPTELHIDCAVDNTRNATILYFGISGVHEASIYMRPDRMLDTMKAAGHLPAEADDFLEFFKQYVDRAKCKAEPYELGANRFYYARVGTVLEHSAQFVGAAEALMQNLSDN